MAKERRGGRDDRRGSASPGDATGTSGAGHEETRVPAGHLSRLTARQADVLALMAEGCSNAAIAAQLGLALKSVENAINTIYQVLEVPSTNGEVHPRVKAVLIFLSENRRRKNRVRRAGELPHPPPGAGGPTRRR